MRDEARRRDFNLGHLKFQIIDYEDSPAIMSWIDDVSERKAAEHELAGVGQF